jgi:hypothetical protein
MSSGFTIDGKPPSWRDGRASDSACDGSVLARPVAMAYRQMRLICSPVCLLQVSSREHATDSRKHVIYAEFRHWLIADPGEGVLFEPQGLAAGLQSENSGKHSAFRSGSRGSGQPVRRQKRVNRGIAQRLEGRHETDSPRACARFEETTPISTF